MSPEGNKILIKGYYEDGKIKERGVSFCSKTTKGWSVPVGLKIKNFDRMNRGKYTSTCMTDDAKTLIFSFSEQELDDKSTLYFSRLENGGNWSEPKTLGQQFEIKQYRYISPHIASDNVSLYFSSDRPGGYGSNDIWMCKRLDSTWQLWSEPLNLGTPINTPGWESSFSIDAAGEYAYMASGSNSFGRTDIVKVALKQEIKPSPVVLIFGNVFNSKTKEPVGADLLYESLPDGTNQGNAFSSPIDGSCKIVLPYGKNYSFRAVAENFIAVSENINIIKSDKYKEIRKDLFLAPIEKGVTVRLNSIFFDPGKSLLRAESFPELDRLLSVLQLNSTLKIEISGHSDNVGEDAANLKLSNERAKAVTIYLNYRGIPVERITSKGYGKSKPVASNTTEQGRQLNRRVEVVIL